MLGSRVRAHLNQDHPSIIFKQAQNCTVLLEVPENSDQQNLEQYCQSLIQYVVSNPITNATEFDTVASDAFRAANLPLSFSIACAYQIENTVYLKTYGSGAIYLKRKDTKLPLVRHGAYAAGNVEEDDILALSVVEGDPFLQSKNTVHLVFQTTDSLIGLDGEVPQETTKAPVVRQNKSVDALQSIIRHFGGRTTAVLGVVILVGLLLLFNVVRSYTSKTAQEDRTNIANTKEIVTQKLEQAEDIAELNTGRAIALLAETKKDLSNLKKKLHSKQETELKKIENQITETERKLIQKNVKHAEEFIDLGLEEKGASGTYMWRYEDKVIILNPKGAVYILSLEKKSLEAKTPAGLSGISLAGLDEGTTYFYKKGTGILKLESEETKPKIAIKQDKEWGSITDLQVYNKNLYLLDSGKGQVYKYIPTDDGFATRSSYFKSGAYAKNAVSFAIDQSVYVAQSSLITKYTSGLQDGFAPQYPDKTPQITRVVTGPDVEELYVWDRTHGTIVVLSKNGDYKKTVESGTLTKATSVEVYNGFAYALVGSKIYRISLK